MKELFRQPGRFASVGGALTLLVVLLVVLGGFLDGLQLGQTGAYRAHEDRLLTFSADSELLIQRSRISNDVRQDVESTKGVAAVGELFLIESTARVAANDGELVDIVLIGYDLATDVVPAPPTAGQAVVDEALADLYDVKVGDTLRVGPTSEPLEVAALVEDLSQGSPTVWIASPQWLEIVQAGNPSALPPPGVSQAYVVELTSEANLEELRDRLSLIDGIEAATVTNATDALPVVQQQSTVFQGIIAVTFVVTLLVVALFFALITLERIDLYAVLKALGARTRELVSGIAAQAVTVSVIALVLGLILSVLFVAALPADLPVRIEPNRLVQVAGGVLITAVLGSLFTLRRLLKIDPAEAIG